MGDILFMIGNGFDLNCGMKTGFQHFYREYIEDQAGDTELIKRFKRDIKFNIQNWGDFELAMGEYAAQFETKEDFLECVNDFSNKLRAYLENVEKNLRMYTKGKEDAIMDEVVDSLTTFGDEVSKNVANKLSHNINPYFGRISFVSFNYTDIADYIIEKAVSRRMSLSGSVHHIIVHHVHGRLGDLTLGCDSEKQILARFDIDDDIRLSFIKPYFNDTYDSQRKSITMHWIDDARFICVYGLSLGESDLMWRLKLVEWLKSFKENHLFLYLYKYASISFKTIPERMVFEKKVKKDLLKEWNVDLETDVFDRFHVICGRNIFNISKVVEQAKQQQQIALEKKKRELAANFASTV
jgi:hypothetical protein